MSASDSVTVLPTPALVLDAACELAEGPVWNQERGELVWVDIYAGRVHWTDVGTGADRSLAVGQAVGAVALRASGGLVLAVEDGFAVLEPGASTTRILAVVEHDVPTNRMNDAKCDSRGRLWAGTIPWDAITAGAGAMYRLDPGGEFDRVLSGLGVSNGIAWSPDGTMMYHVDSLRGVVTMYDYEPGAGVLGVPRPLIVIPPEHGEPDGLTVDAEGRLWLALWGGSAVRCYGSDGRHLQTIPLPVSQVTSCTFGGPDLRDLYITTAWSGLSTAQRRDQPHAGGIFRARAGCQGLLPDVFGG